MKVRQAFPRNQRNRGPSRILGLLRDRRPRDGECRGRHRPQRSSAGRPTSSSQRRKDAQAAEKGWMNPRKEGRRRKTSGSIFLRHGTRFLADFPQRPLAARPARGVARCRHFQAGWLMDDYHHRAALLPAARAGGLDPAVLPRGTPAGFFCFLDGEPEHLRRAMEWGPFPGGPLRTSGPASSGPSHSSPTGWTTGSGPTPPR